MGLSGNIRLAKQELVFICLVLVAPSTINPHTIIFISPSDFTIITISIRGNIYFSFNQTISFLSELFLRLAEEYRLLIIMYNFIFWSYIVNI